MSFTSAYSSLLILLLSLDVYTEVLVSCSCTYPQVPMFLYIKKRISTHISINRSCWAQVWRRRLVVPRYFLLLLTLCFETLCLLPLNRYSCCDFSQTCVFLKHETWSVIWYTVWNFASYFIDLLLLKRWCLMNWKLRLFWPEICDKSMRSRTSSLRVLILWHCPR